MNIKYVNEIYEAYNPNCDLMYLGGKFVKINTIFPSLKYQQGGWTFFSLHKNIFLVKLNIDG